MTDDFRLLMISAMYENGGNTTHRFLDGHPQLFVYPFESQLGTYLVQDPLTSLFPVKYRWPVFALHASPSEDYRAIIDEECRVRARTPAVSKFRHVSFDFSDDERGRMYEEHIGRSGRSRPHNVAAFFRATFDAWRNRHRSPEQTVYVGYSPILIVDGEQILRELPNAHLLHVVRNPWSAYADTKRRPVPLTLDRYMFGWTVNQYHALLLQRMWPDRVDIVRTEDVMHDPVSTLGHFCQGLGLESSASLKTPSWNGTPLDEVYPWGTIRLPTVDANRAAAASLSDAERGDIAARAWQYLETFDYRA